VHLTRLVREKIKPRFSLSEASLKWISRRFPRPDESEINPSGFVSLVGRLIVVFCGPLCLSFGRVSGIIPKQGQ